MRISFTDLNREYGSDFDGWDWRNTSESPIHAELLHGLVAYALRGKDATIDLVVNGLEKLAIDQVEACWSTEPVGKLGVVADVEVTSAFAQDVYSFIGANDVRKCRTPSLNLTTAPTNSVEFQRWLENRRWEACGNYPEVWGHCERVKAIWVTDRASWKVHRIAHELAETLGLPLYLISKYDGKQLLVDYTRPAKSGFAVAECLNK